MSELEAAISEAIAARSTAPTLSHYWYWCEKLELLFRQLRELQLGEYDDEQPEEYDYDSNFKRS